MRILLKNTLFVLLMAHAIAGEQHPPASSSASANQIAAVARLRAKLLEKIPLGQRAWGACGNKDIFFIEMITSNIIEKHLHILCYSQKCTSSQGGYHSRLPWEIKVL